MPRCLGLAHCSSLRIPCPLEHEFCACPQKQRAQRGTCYTQRLCAVLQVTKMLLVGCPLAAAFQTGFGRAGMTQQSAVSGMPAAARSASAAVRSPQAVMAESLRPDAAGDRSGAWLASAPGWMCSVCVDMLPCPGRTASGLRGRPVEPRHDRHCGAGSG